MIRVATAFSGGLAAPEFALKYSGIEHEIVFAYEWDKYARKQYLQFHGKPTTFYEDIKNLCAKRYYALIDLFIFGSPCQNLSLAGNQKGLEGQKSKYFFEGYRVLSEMMPKVFIFENVKGLLSSNKGKDFALVMKMFRDLGYHCAHTVLNTKDYGVPQNRERVFVVGFLDVNAYHDFNFLPGFPLEKRLRDVLESEVDEKYYLSKKMIDGFVNHTERHQEKGTGFKWEPKILQLGRGFNNGGEHEICPILTINSFEQNNFVIYDSYNGNIKKDGLACTLTNNCGASSLRSGQKVIEPMIRQKSQSGVRYREDCGTLSASANHNDMCVIEPKIVAMRGRNPINPKSREEGLETVQMLEPNEQGIANTLTTVQKDNLVQYWDYRIRRLTPRECFRLQGVRDEDINIVVSDTQAYKIAGNAMSVPPLEMLITQIFRPQRIASLFSA